MRIEPIKLDIKNKFIREYRNKNADIMEYFDYPMSEEALHDRVHELKKRHFKREQLTEILTNANKRWNAPKATLDNIERLKRPESVVVIGGQQAGLLTGPTYTINKVISIIVYAKQQEELLNIPVIPVFWVAGEDHDFEEINHLFVEDASKFKKIKLAHEIMDKRSISDIPIETEAVHQWLNMIFAKLPESKYTKDLYNSIKNCLDRSQTYVDFFAHLIFQLFQEEGVVLIDSGDAQIRQLESDYFIEIIEKQTEISTGVCRTANKLRAEGYTLSVDVTETDGHLFYHLDNERILLKRDAKGNWVGKQNELILTTEALITHATYTPEHLSNNVITRPLMQDLVFPSLAFIGGPGEISYWSVLKPAFHALNIKMPPVIPRLSFTFIDRNVDKVLKKYTIPVKTALENGVEEYKMNWLQSQTSPSLDLLVVQLKQIVEKAHGPLRDIADTLGADMKELANKNLNYLFNDIDYMQDKLVKSIEEKFSHVLAEFDFINNKLNPHGGLQERIWNPLPWLNHYGYGIIEDLINEQYSFDEEHYLIYL